MKKSIEQQLLDQLLLDDLKEPHRTIVELIGLDDLLKLVDFYGGSSIYIPQKRDFLKIKIYKTVYREFDGNNIKRLAKKYDLSESTIYNIIRGNFNDIIK